MSLFGDDLAEQLAHIRAFVIVESVAAVVPIADGHTGLMARGAKRAHRCATAGLVTVDRVRLSTF